MIALAAEVDPGNVAQVEKLRREGERELVGAALDLAVARRKAVAKFGAKRAATLWADPRGVEMATSAVVGDCKSIRFLLAWPYWEMSDLCCGIGGDTIALARDRMEVVPIDLDPVRAWMAQRNSGRRAVVGDIATASRPDGPFHIDPARRDAAGRRAWAMEDLDPPVGTWRSIVRENEWGGAVKLGPGLNFAEWAERFPESQVEVISENGTLVQAVAWFGALRWYKASATRVATLARGTPEHPEAPLSLAGHPSEPLPMRTPEFLAGRHLYEPDDSVERAELLGTLCEQVGAPMLHPRVGLLTSDARIESPWLTAFEVLEEMAWNEKRVKGVLEARGAGIVEVKTRGGVVDPDSLQGRLRGKGEEQLTVFVLRLGREFRAIVARRPA